MSNDLKWMLSSDQHIPYHDPRYIDLWFQVMKWFRPDAIDYLGDTSDQDCFSKYSIGTSQEFLNQVAKPVSEKITPFIMEQERPVAEFYEQTRKMRKNADIFIALGNHCVRVFDYVDRKMPDEAKAITPESLWKLDSLGINYIHYADLPKKRYGDIHVHHGNAISQHAGESVRKDVENFGVSIIRGHSHRAGTFYKTYELKNETLRGYEIGHSTDIKSSGMSYSNLHNWQAGFAVAHVVDGYPHVQFIEMTPDYTCVVDGRTFKA
ncbi:metallophosphoesterase [Rhodococcus phage Weasels2]|uniref:Metallophosphoesterase n=1 Tax=Rhodococcus phage Weasels2 TaxID=1897437 RepID=A0A1I9SA72_9CAUD|nr:metallophosphoesterase [Rhodococcus phage Weasels2]AOZ63678.1 metallophosphoesterase [Rhodococcus phage Weasels2]